MNINYENTSFLNENLFKAILDETCERLWNKKAQHSIRRIDEMEAQLLNMQGELELFLFEHEDDL